MRFVRVLLIAAATIAVGAMNGSAAHAQLAFGGGGGGGGGKGGGGGFSFGGIGKSGGFHGRSFSTGKGRFVGKGGFRHGRYGHRFKYAKRFKYPIYAYGWPAFGAVVQNTVLRDQPVDEQPITPPPPPRVAEWKIYQVGTPGGCKSERVNVQQGAVNVIRC